MAVKMRLTRLGDKKSPFYRIVVVDSRKARDGEYIEKIGHYNPTVQPEDIVIDEAKAKDWLSKGVQPTETVKTLLIRQGIMEKSTKLSAPGRKFAKRSIEAGERINAGTCEYVVEQFAEHKDEIEYRVEEKDNATDIVVVLEESDMGKVIGKQGKIAKALRTLVRCASAKEGKKYNIEIKEKARRNNGIASEEKRFSLFFLWSEYARKTRYRSDTQAAGHPRRTQSQASSGRRIGYQEFPHRLCGRKGISDFVCACGRRVCLSDPFRRCRQERRRAAARQRGGGLRQEAPRPQREGIILSTSSAAKWSRKRGYVWVKSPTFCPRIRIFSCFRTGKRRSCFLRRKVVVEDVDVEKKQITVNEKRFNEVAAEQ